MKKICLMAGHENAGTGMSKGAPGEVEFNIDVRNRVAAMLRERGFEVTTTDANANKDSAITSVDWDLFLSIHYDADVYNDSGGFVDYPEPSTDGATNESQRICKILSDEYFRITGIKNKPARSNANTRYFYVWKSLTSKTPCNLIECGVGWRVPDDHNLFTYEREKVFEGITRGICKAFDVPYDLTPPPTCDDLIKEAVTSAISENDKKWQTKLESANKTIDDLTSQIASNLSYSELFSIAWKKFWAIKRG